MSQIEISCVGSTAVFTNTPNIFSGGNVDTVKFEFDNEWSNFTTKTAVFYTSPKETALQILDTDNVANIPPNMLAKKSKLSVGVIGTNTNGDVKTSKILTYVVGKGAITNDMETTAPTPDIWLQMLAIVEHNKEIVEHNKEIVDNMELIVDESQLTNKANKDLSNVSVDQAIKNLGLHDYQKPWNIDENVDNICVNQDTGVYAETLVQGETVENSRSYTMINSGSVILGFTCAYCAEYTGEPMVIVSINGATVKTFTSERFGTHGNVDIANYGSYNEVTLNVNKGDVVTLTAVCTGLYNQQTATNKWAKTGAYKVRLKANIDTPYKYFNLLPVENPVSLTEVLNALLGV